jgi:hypothetical protein
LNDSPSARKKIAGFDLSYNLLKPMEILEQNARKNAAGERLIVKVFIMDRIVSRYYDPAN